MSEVGPGGSEPFNHDVRQYGGYVYTTNQRLSSRLATDRQVELISGFGRLAGRRVVDLGCGDGTFTRRYMAECKPRSMAGLDGAAGAIEVARSRPGSGNIDFRTGSTEDLPWADDSFDLAILQGVLHHTDRPAASIAEALRVAAEVVCVEPNGYSPVLKLLERVSPYHRAHHERSFSARRLKGWVEDAGGRVTDECFAILVPYFSPDLVARILKHAEPVVERTPILGRFLLAVYVFKATRDHN